MKLEGSPAPSSSSNHVVLERLNNGKSDRHKLDSAELPRIGEEDIHNVIGSLGYLNDSLQQQERREEAGTGKPSWLMAGDNNSAQFPSHGQITAHRTHAFTTGQSYGSPGQAEAGLSPMFGYSNSQHSYSDGHSIQSPTANVPPIPSLFSSNMSLSPPDDPYSYHPSGGFPPYQTSLKRPKKKARSPKMGPDGVPCKRKSREGTTTHLWEFLLKLLQV